MRLKLRLAYTGTAYMGWQIQGNDTGLTIQARLEQALARLTGVFVRAHGSGRTDAGVHAEAQYVHCDIPDECVRIRDWRHSLNALLPRDIRVLSAEPAALGFHARYSAKCKTYRYRFWQERGFVLPALQPFVWDSGPLDVGRMREGAQALLGTHDFASLANTGTSVKSTIRTILRAEIEESLPGTNLPPCLPMITLTITGTGFLKQMVRNIAGTLADIGRGKLEASAIPAILKARDRRALKSITAPASGLTLLDVRYPDMADTVLSETREPDRESERP